MSKSLRRHEGYYLIDHTASPGNQVAPEGTKFESAIVTCSHCQRGVVLNPDRSRPRGYCPGCDRYVCDTCEAVRAQTGCQSMERTLDRLQEEAYQALNLKMI